MTPLMGAISLENSGSAHSEATLIGQLPLPGLLDALPQGLYVIDPAGTCVYANPAAAQMLGHHVTDLVDADVHELVHHSRGDGSVYPRDECPGHKAASSGTPTVTDNETLWRADGSPIAVDYHARPILADGQIVGAAVTVVEAERQRNTLEPLLSVLDSVGEAFVGVDDEGRIDGWNAAAQTLLGWQPHEVIGRPVVDVLTPARNRHAHHRGLARLVSGNPGDLSAGPTEILVLHRDGHEIPVHATLSRIRWSGRGASTPSCGT